MSDGRGPVAVALVALAFACVAAFVMGSPAPSLRGEPAARAFLDAWRAGRNATYVADYQFTRTLPDGKRFVQSTRTVQRPPGDRLVIGLGSVAGRVGGKVLRCASSPDGGSKCTTGGDAEPYAEDVDGEIETLQSYVIGDRPMYDVIAFADSHDRCFRLDLAVAIPSPPYGNHALFCFDPTAAVPTRTVVQRTEATDELVPVAVRTEVTDADLSVPADIGTVVGLPGSSSTTTSTTGTTSTTLAAN